MLAVDEELTELSSSTSIPRSGSSRAEERLKSEDNYKCTSGDYKNLCQHIGELNLGRGVLRILLTATCTYVVDDDLVDVVLVLIIVAESLDGFLFYCNGVTYCTFLTCGKSCLKTGSFNAGEFYLGVTESIAGDMSADGTNFFSSAGRILGLVTESRDNNVLSVCELGESCVGEYRVALGAVPELVRAVIFTACINVLGVYNLCGVRYGKILSVCKNLEILVSEYRVTLCAVPILFTAVLVATGLNHINVCDIIAVIRNGNSL